MIESNLKVDELMGLLDSFKINKDKLADKLKGMAYKHECVNRENRRYINMVVEERITKKKNQRHKNNQT